jgi:hypothetical protein
VDELKPDSILIAEFEYIAQSGFQVTEDRAKVSSFYLVTVGSIFAAILGANIDGADTQIISFIFAVLFGFLTINSILTLLKLTQLRLAWLDAVKAMNHIREFYEQHFDSMKLSDAFMWKTLPPKFKLQSLSFVLAIEVGVLGGITFGTAIIFAGRATNQWLWNQAFVLGIGLLIFELIGYRLLLLGKSA